MSNIFHTKTKGKLVGGGKEVGGSESENPQNFTLPTHLSWILRSGDWLARFPRLCFRGSVTPPFVEGVLEGGSTVSLVVVSNQK